MDALEMLAASAVGSSSGGYVAQQLAVDHPGERQRLSWWVPHCPFEGAAPFAADAESLTDPIAEDQVYRFLTSFPLVQGLQPCDRIASFTSLVTFSRQKLPAAPQPRSGFAGEFLFSGSEFGARVIASGQDSRTATRCRIPLHCSVPALGTATMAVSLEE